MNILLIQVHLENLFNFSKSIFNSSNFDSIFVKLKNNLNDFIFLQKL
jgi:hypothetical protein